MNRPWMPLYVGDYLGDTGHLTTTQHGAYLLLMMHYWRKGELPDDDRQLSKIAKLPLKTWCDYRATLQDFFYDGWKHKRIDAELQRMMSVSAKRAIAGQKGGIGSALSRMKLESALQPRRIKPQANADQTPSSATAVVDHSHSHQILMKAGALPLASAQEQSSGEAADALRGNDGKPSVVRPCVVSPELAVYVARRIPDRNS
jgi:uncharacterized protein YdaU (DUF1376 family)